MDEFQKRHAKETRHKSHVPSYHMYMKCPGEANSDTEGSLVRAGGGRTWGVAANGFLPGVMRFWNVNVVVDVTVNTVKSPNWTLNG